MFDDILFFFSAVMAVGGAIKVVSDKNIMHACVYLLCSLIGVAGLYLTLGADFVAAIQLIVYVGGIVILMLFAIMLTGGVDFVSKIKTQNTPLMGNFKTYTIASLTSLVFSMSVLKLLSGVFKSKEIVKALPPFSPTVEKIGELLVTDHVLAFEISSVLLLGALVGAATIARPRKR
ncbi:MAG: NADH-quinone oxidoreductase subunit J [Halobacteriovoraceae bacterium]|nr:NADH-quinone oxidoreductase subunit J [Halobacteriovoraceae bacterium]